MAVKMYSDTTQCSSTSDGNSMRGEVSTSSMYQNYSITANLGIWSISASPLYKMPRFFQIVSSSIRNVVVISEPTSQLVSSELCIQKYGGVLSGFDTMDEINYMIGQVSVTKILFMNEFHSQFADITVPLFSSTTSYPWDGFWINGFRKETCRFSNQTDPDCPGIKGFTLTDPLLSNTNFYIWGFDKQPNGMSDGLGTSNCIVIRINGKSGGGMDDIPCDGSQSGSVYINGYVCGLRPNEI
ncbi:hypothetical protein CRE_28550 [Caenorhabditis remanei]|uniref:Uncharacterized protein n=1 Tax=Caenorhabditis remanei TaxID=31234 RepID=E3LMZ7_CAERE|nr:hypothetical protein CRE_28550 [Caenorhabditis remanei]